MKAIATTLMALLTVTAVNAQNPDLNRFMNHYAGRADFNTREMNPSEMPGASESMSLETMYVISSEENADEQVIKDTKMDAFLLSDRQSYDPLADFATDNGQGDVTIYGKIDRTGNCTGLIIVEHSRRKGAVNMVIMEGRFDGQMIAALKAAGEAQVASL